MTENPNNNKINELCDYLATNYSEENNISSLLFGLVLVLVQVFLQKLVKVFNPNSTQIFNIIIQIECFSSYGSRPAGGLPVNF